MVVVVVVVAVAVNVCGTCSAIFNCQNYTNISSTTTSASYTVQDETTTIVSTSTIAIGNSKNTSICTTASTSTSVVIKCFQSGGSPAQSRRHCVLLHGLGVSGGSFSGTRGAGPNEREGGKGRGG